MSGWVCCEACGAETPCTKTGPDNCPKCGAYLWEDEMSDDTPDEIVRFADDL